MCFPTGNLYSWEKVLVPDYVDKKILDKLAELNDKTFNDEFYDLQLCQ